MNYIMNLFKSKKSDEEEIADDIVLDDITARSRNTVVPDWHFVRLTNYSYGSLSALREWLDSYTTARYKTIGIGESCPYEVGVLFEDEIDAMAFKLVWYEDDGDEEEDY